MNIRRILISEQEKKSILSMYNVDTNLVNEQLDKTTGKYSLKNPQILRDSEKSNNRYDIKIPKGTMAWHDFNGNDTKVWIGGKNRAFTSVPSHGSTSSGNKRQSVYYDCAFNGDVKWFKTIGDIDGLVYNESLSKVIRATFCNGSKMKTWKEITGGGDKTVVNPPNSNLNPTNNTTGKKCYTASFTPTETQKCKLPGDKTWVYAKDDSGKWFTSRQSDGKKWCELVLPQYQKAVDILIKGCPTTTEPIKLDDKPAEIPQQTQPTNTQPTGDQTQTTGDQTQTTDGVTYTAPKTKPLNLIGKVYNYESKKGCKISKSIPIKYGYLIYAETPEKVSCNRGVSIDNGDKIYVWLSGDGRLTTRGNWDTQKNEFNPKPDYIEGYINFIS